MIKEAIDRVIQLATPTNVTVGGRDYATTPLTPVKVNLDGLIVHSLSGFGQAITEKLAAKVLDYNSAIVHVVDWKTVQLVPKELDTWGNRPALVTAKLLEVEGFKFSKWYDHEEFVIEAQSKFDPNQGDYAYILKIASSVVAEQVSTSDDDGISQRVGVRRGVSLKGEEVLRPRVELAPFRTFAEATQPKTPFIFRVRNQGDQVPELALFEADGGAWKTEAIEAIASHLKYYAKVELPIIA